MADDYKSYRIRTTVGGNDNVLNVKLTQTYDTLEVLSLKIDQKNSYKTFRSDYGIVIGRVFANGGYGVPNAKVSVFIKSENNNILDENILYPYKSTNSLGVDNIRYNLLPESVDVACHQDVGTFPNKRYVLDNDDIIEIFDKYYTYTTTTNSAGDYMLFGIPIGINTLHMDVDLSDIGVLSQHPRDFLYKGYNINQFDSPTKFKKSTNLSSLVQIMSEDKEVYVYPYWGDTSETDSDIAITRCDFELSYKFEPTCVFMGSIVTDTGSNSISKRCTPDEKSGQMSELVAGGGTIEMIRKTFDNKIEQYSVNGNQNIDENGVWCYQIPMNLDYIVTDEFGNIVPSNDPEHGIPTRTRARFRISMNEMPNDNKARNRCRYLVPNNPRIDDERFPEFTKQMEVDYEFGSMTKDENFCDMFWNNVYTVKNYIPRIQKDSNVKNGKRKFGGIKLISHYGDNNPMPYNQVTTRMDIGYMLLCNIFKFIIDLVVFLNWLITYVVGGLICLIATPFCALAKVHIWKWHPFGFLNPVCNGLKKLIPKCVGIDGSFCGEYLTHAYTFYPGCGNCSQNLGLGSWINTQKDHVKKQNEQIRKKEIEPSERTVPNNDTKAEELRNCIETALAENYNVISFNFNNDWVNGVLYMPLWFRKITKKKTYFFGIFSKKAEDLWCSAEINKPSGILKLVQPCAVDHDLMTEPNNGCGGKNEGCLTAKGVVSLQHGIIVKKQTMLGQDVYYYSACEIEGGYVSGDGSVVKTEGATNFVKLLYATDIVLLGSLNFNDIKGIPQFYMSLESTTYRMPPNVLQTANDVSVGDDGEIAQTSTSEYTGRDWGNSNSDLCDSGKKSKDGGLFYGIGCSSTQMTPKSCINVSRICEFGVSLDEDTPVISREIMKESEDLSSVIDYITPDGFVSYDEINNESQRSAFATLNGNFLQTVISKKTGLKEYKFKYLHIDNFDGALSKFMAQEQSKCSKIQRNNHMLEIPSKGYISFRLGINDKKRFEYPTIVSRRYFPRYENSFYFYFGLKEGKTALDKLHKFYVADCEDMVSTESPVNIFSIGNSWCNIGTIFTDEHGNVKVNDYDGFVAFDLSKIELPCTILMQQEDDFEGINEREFQANDEKVYISTVPYTDGACVYPDEEVEIATPEIINGETTTENEVHVIIKDVTSALIAQSYEYLVKRFVYYTYTIDGSEPETPDENNENTQVKLIENGTANEIHLNVEITNTVTSFKIKAKVCWQIDLEGYNNEKHCSEVKSKDFIINNGTMHSPTAEAPTDGDADNNEHGEDVTDIRREMLKGYNRICLDAYNERLLMVANGIYNVYITDNNGDIWSSSVTITQKKMECFITPTNFDTPFKRLMEKYASMYIIMSNRVFENGIDGYTTNLTRKIGGTINISRPKDGVTGEYIPNFKIEIRCEDEDLGYNIKIEFHDNENVVTQTTFNGQNALIYPNNINRNTEGFIFGVPKGDTNYYVTVVQKCKISDGEGEYLYVDSDNVIEETIFITDKTQYKLIINDIVDYDVIKHWKCGFSVENANPNAYTAVIRQTNDISNEWFHLSDENNYHWYDYDEYNKRDKELLELLALKVNEVSEVKKDEVLNVLYNEVISEILNDSDYQYVKNIEGRIMANAVKNYLYDGRYTYVDVAKIINGLTKERNVLANKCLEEIKKTINASEYNGLDEYGKQSYDIVYLNNIVKGTYITKYEWENTQRYFSKIIDFYPYEYVSNSDGNVEEVITYYGYVDLSESDSNTPSNVRNNYEAIKYISINNISETPTYFNRDERNIQDFGKYIPHDYTYTSGGNTYVGRCLTNNSYNTFISPGRFRINDWGIIDEIEIGDDNTIGGVELNDQCSSNNYMIYKLRSVVNGHSTDVIPYLGYNTLQYSNKKDKYEIKSYIKIIDNVEYQTTYNQSADLEPYQYIKTVKVLDYEITNETEKDNLRREDYEKSLLFKEHQILYYWQYHTLHGVETFTHNGEDVNFLTGRPKVYYISSFPSNNITTAISEFTGNDLISVNCYNNNNGTIKLWTNPDTLGTEDEVWTDVQQEGYKYAIIQYIPQYIQKDRLSLYRYSQTEYDNLDEYGQLAYDTREENTKYRNKYDNNIIGNTEWSDLTDTGKFDYTPKTYCSVSLTRQMPDAEHYYGDIRLVTNVNNISQGEVYDYMESKEDVDEEKPDLINVHVLNWQHNDNGRILIDEEYQNINDYSDIVDKDQLNYEPIDVISSGEYENADYLKEYYVPCRYIFSTEDEGVITPITYYLRFNNNDTKTVDELENSVLNQSFYTILEYEYIINEEEFNTLSSNEQSLFIKEVREENTVYILKISKELYEDDESIEQINIIDYDDDEVLFVVNRADLVPFYVNILNNLDKKTNTEYQHLLVYSKENYYPYEYEEKIGSEVALIDCDEDDSENSLFVDIVNIDEAMVTTLNEIESIKNDFILGAKSTFYMTCTDNSHVLSFRAITDDKPVAYHLVYKEEETVENDVDGTTYNALSDVDSYVCDGTNEITVSIPSICSKDDTTWGNECHIIPSNGNWCFARDNTRGVCNSNDRFWRKAFFVAVVNGKNEPIPMSTLTNKNVPTDFFGVHVMDKRFKNRLVVWPIIKDIPKFEWVIGNGDKGKTVNMFGSIAGYVENGIIDSLKIVKNTECGGYHPYFEEQNVGEIYDLEFFATGEIDEDNIVKRYVSQEDVNEILYEMIKTDVIKFNGDNASIIESVYNDYSVTNAKKLFFEFKPFTVYNTIKERPLNVINKYNNITEDTSITSKQCTILPSEVEGEIIISDFNGCEMETPFNSNMSIKLDNISVNDCRNIIYGSTSEVLLKKLDKDSTDTSFLSVSVENGDSDEYTFYAFEYTSWDSYPLNSATKITDSHSFDNIYRNNFGNYNDTNITNTLFNNTDNAKFLFNYKNEVSSVIQNVDKCDESKYVESSEDNIKIFKACITQMFSIGDIKNAIIAKLGDGQTSDCLISTDEIDLQEYVETLNNSCLYRRAQFTSGMARPSKKYAEKERHLYYNPTFDGFADYASAAVPSTPSVTDYGEFNVNIGFSHSGEFALRQKGITLAKFKTENIDTAEEKNSNGDKVHRGSFDLDVAFGFNTTNSHKPHYIVAISNDSVCRAISPVYDFRIMYAKLSKKYIGNGQSYVYEVSMYIDESHTAQSYYFYYFPYQIVDYEIKIIKYGTADTNTPEGTVSGDDNELLGGCTSNTVLYHTADKTMASEYCADNYIDGLKDQTGTVSIHLSGILANMGFFSDNSYGAEGYITVKDVVGLKHIIPINKNSFDRNAESANSSDIKLYAFTIVLNGGKWKNSMVGDNLIKVPDSLIGTTNDYAFIVQRDKVDNNGNLKPEILNGFIEQMEMTKFGVDYHINPINNWTITNYNNTQGYKANWEYTYDNNTMVMIQWKWLDQNGDYTLDAELPSKRNYDGVKTPQLDIIEYVDNDTQRFTNTWRIKRNDGTYETINNNNSFKADVSVYTMIYRNGKDYIQLYANYTETTGFTLTFKDWYLVDYNTNAYGERYTEITVPNGTLVSRFNAHNPQVSVPPGYSFIKWNFGSLVNVISDMDNIFARWKYSIKFNIRNELQTTRTITLNGQTAIIDTTMSLIDNIIIQFEYDNELQEKEIGLGNTIIAYNGIVSESSGANLKYEVTYDTGVQQFNTNVASVNSIKNIYIKTKDDYINDSIPEELKIHYYCYNPQMTPGEVVNYRGIEYTYFNGTSVEYSVSNNGGINYFNIILKL